MPFEKPVSLTRTVAKGTPVFRQGDSARNAFIVLRGKVALSVGLEHGTELFLFAQDSGSVLGLAETLLGTEYQTTATAVTSVTVHTISRADILDMTKDARSGLTVLSLLAEKLGQIYRVLKHSTRGKRGHGPSRLLAGLHVGSRDSKPTIH
jgi:CRP-like cAMP-binding protein